MITTGFYFCKGDGLSKAMPCEKRNAGIAMITIVADPVHTAWKQLVIKAFRLFIKYAFKCILTNNSQAKCQT